MSAPISITSNGQQQSGATLVHSPSSPVQILHSPPQHVYPISSPATHVSASPNTATGGHKRRSSSVTVQQPAIPKPMHQYTSDLSEADEQIRAHPKILLLENINEAAVLLLREQGYSVETEKGALAEDDLIARIQKGKYTAIGIRSKTKITKKVIESTSTLITIGCFCIGTNQVDLAACAKAGIAVFNSPYANSRSVAELVICEIIALSRQIVDRASEMRAGVFNKLSKGCWEIRGKTLGIVGYGHIGSQLSVLAEALGMTVKYFDIIPIMPLGSATQVASLEDLLTGSDFVTLHVPELPETTDLISTEELAMMKKGSYLINNARGKVVDLPALADSLLSGHLAGAAVDVFPKEPAGNGPHFNDNLNPFASALQKCPNLIMTPHIGGSTEEAQRMIGAEVGAALIRYINFGSSIGAVNFPEVSLRPVISENILRLCHVHLNQPGVLKNVNAILGDYNVERQLSDSKGDVAYLMADIKDVGKQEMATIYDRIQSLPANVATRLLW